VSEPLRARKDTDGDIKRDLEFPPLPEPLTVPVYDNHTHLEIADGENPLSPEENLRRAVAVGIAGVVQVGTDLETSQWGADLADRDPRVLAAVAIHPNEAPKLAERGVLDDHIEGIAELATRGRVRAVGETGLDYFRTDESGRAPQMQSFEAHIDIAKSNGIALQIHDRDAHGDVVATLLRVGAPEKTVLHCFSGDAELAKTCADHGWYLSFAGTVTFGNAKGIREALSIAPRELVLVETDAPFLTPTPFRGRPNGSYLIPLTLRFMAEHLGVSVDELGADVARNTETVYGTW
jgi:TatD DNase family protein